jgi:hypothetical protein
MYRVIIIILLTIQVPFFMMGQNDETIEIQFDKVDSNSNIDIQKFHKKFNSYIDSKETGLAKINLNEETMINNFIIFSEDGLIMKDFNFHTIESCKKQILLSRPKPTSNKSIQSNWIFVSMESHVNQNELIKILEYLSKENIEYQFGEEDEIMAIINKN